ncbi:hypothetical protein R1flu_024909 [Riccia fluitans]|uniref:Uncharacterized protein n=1 Tax=Riccia fluitans TaxID=41844 RepID=A0ABD1XW91_9MARC
MVVTRKELVLLRCAAQWKCLCQESTVGCPSVRRKYWSVLLDQPTAMARPNATRRACSSSFPQGFLKTNEECSFIGDFVTRLDALLLEQKLGGF